MAAAALPAVTLGSWGSATALPRVGCTAKSPQHRGLPPASGRGNLTQEHPGNRDIHLGSFSLLSPWSCRGLLLPPVHETWVSLRIPINPKCLPELLHVVTSHTSEVLGGWVVPGLSWRSEGHKWVSVRAFQGPATAFGKRKGAVPHSSMLLSWDGEQHRVLYLLSCRCDGVGLGEASHILPGEPALEFPHKHKSIHSIYSPKITPSGAGCFSIHLHLGKLLEVRDIQK